MSGQPGILGRQRYAPRYSHRACGRRSFSKLMDKIGPLASTIVCGISRVDFSAGCGGHLWKHRWIVVKLTHGGEEPFFPVLYEEPGDSVLDQFVHPASDIKANRHDAACHGLHDDDG